MVSEENQEITGLASSLEESARALTGTTQDPEHLAVQLFRASHNAFELTRENRLNLQLNNGSPAAISIHETNISGESIDGSMLFAMDITENNLLAYDIHNLEAAEEMTTKLEHALEVAQAAEETTQNSTHPELGIG